MKLLVLLMLISSNAFAQYVSPPPPMIDSGANTMLLNAATTSYSGEDEPDEVECMQALVSRKLDITKATAVRLAKIDFKGLKRVSVAAYLCNDRNQSACIRLRYSDPKKTTPVAVGILPKTLGCAFVVAQNRNYEMKFLNVRVMSEGVLTSNQIFDTYIYVSDLNKLSTIETSNYGVLQVFPTQFVGRMVNPKK